MRGLGWYVKQMKYLLNPMLNLGVYDKDNIIGRHKSNSAYYQHEGTSKLHQEHYSHQHPPSYDWMQNREPYKWNSNYKPKGKQPWDNKPTPYNNRQYPYTQHYNEQYQHQSYHWQPNSIQPPCNIERKQQSRNEDLKHYPYPSTHQIPNIPYPLDISHILTTGPTVSKLVHQNGCLESKMINKE